VAAKGPARKPRAAKAKPKKPAATPAKTASGPDVKLGELVPNGISAPMYALIERGAKRRPRVLRGLRGTVEIRFKEDFAPVQVEFSPKEVVVKDGQPEPGNGKAERPDLVITGSLPDIVQLASAPLVGGVPKPTNKRGRAALASWAGGRVKIDGSPLLARRLLKLLEI
jgi:hypothetical protein